MESISKIHLKFLKILLGVKKSCSNVAVIGDTGQIPLACSTYPATLNFWNRLESKCKEDDDSLVTLAYALNKRENLPWYKSVNALMVSIDMKDYFDNPEEDICFKTTAQNAMTSMIKKQWKCNLKTNKKLKFYSYLKKEMGFEKYLDIVSYYKDRKLLTKFRCSNHNLEIEKGRHNNIIRKERLCKLCKKQVETEKHFLIFCPAFNSIREKGFTKNCLSYVRSDESDLISKITSFLRKAQHIRDHS